MSGENRIVVKIAEECDGKSVQPLRPALQANLLSNDPGAIRFEQYTIDRQDAGSSGHSKLDEFSSVNCRGRQAFVNLGFEESLLFSIPRAATARGMKGKVQKLKMAWKSTRRLAADVPAKGPPNRAFGLSKKGEPSVPLGFAGFTSLKALRMVTPSVKL